MNREYVLFIDDGGEGKGMGGMVMIGRKGRMGSFVDDDGS